MREPKHFGPKSLKLKSIIHILFIVIELLSESLCYVWGHLFLGRAHHTPNENVSLG